MEPVEEKHRLQPNPRDVGLARDYARRLRERLGDNLLSVTLYGSRARGEAREGSDFDLIITVRHCSAEAREAVQRVDVEMMNEFDELFVSMIYDEAAWKKTEKFPFGRNVSREGLSL